MSQSGVPGYLVLVRHPKAGELYIPGNDDEEGKFRQGSCGRCARVTGKGGGKRKSRKNTPKDMAGKGCEILSRESGSAKLEWIHAEDGSPKCSSLVGLGERIAPRCSRTMDMFEAGG